MYIYFIIFKANLTNFLILVAELEVLSLQAAQQLVFVVDLLCLVEIQAMVLICHFFLSLGLVELALTFMFENLISQSEFLSVLPMTFGITHQVFSHKEMMYNLSSSSCHSRIQDPLTYHYFQLEVDNRIQHSLFQLDRQITFSNI